MIPQIIHYCWFGKNEKPDNIKSYIKEWHQILPNYQFIEWNEDNFPIDYCTYTKEAYEMKKYAFVSDVARLYAINKYGGIYLDTDIEVLKDFSAFLNCSAIFSFESKDLLMTGFFAAEHGNKIIADLLEEYKNRKFKLENGKLNLVANTVYLTSYLHNKKNLEKNGLPQRLGEIDVYNFKTFGGFNADDSMFEISTETYLVHHCFASWGTRTFRVQFALKKHIAHLWGGRLYKTLRRILRKG